uniref:Uncharacterized protein n=1 Tax=Oryza sativa subsp. japonica TaxID=39947 RepID=Q6UUH9_ORYSJ|nr:hypothetical protein OSJNBa0003M24.13 [Oryza sativa Japonica Group]
MGSTWAGVPNKVTSPKAHDRWRNTLFLYFADEFGDEIGFIGKKIPRAFHRLKTELVIYPGITNLQFSQVYSDLTVDYFKMFMLNVPAAVVALTLFFFLDDLTGFEITYLLELPEPFSFIFTWFAALPLIFWVAQAITSAIVKDFLILKGPCLNCGNENLSFFGTILSVPSGGARNSVKCANCGSSLVYDSASRLITLPETAEA